MSNDNKTLADVQPGGRVRLGGADPVRSALEDALQFVETLHSTAAGETRKIVWRCLERGRAALSAQPSPGGQDVLFIEELAELRRLVPSVNQKHALDAAIAALAARQPVAATQPSGNSGELAVDTQPMGEAVCSGGFVISNGSGEKYMAWGQVGPEWTADRSAALWLVRRADAEALAAENEDAWSILPVERCALPPNGWACTLAAGHEGPCPTIAAPPAQAVDLGQFRAQVAELLRREFDLEVADPDDHRHDDGAGEADRIAGTIAALIDSQAVGNG